MSLDLKLRVQYGSFDLDVDIQLPLDGVTAIFGPSGCGKTTLLRTIAGLDQHAETSLSIGDEVWQEEAVFVASHRRRVGYVFQEASLFPHLSVQGNVEYGWKRVPKSERRISPERAMALLGLDEFRDRRPESLSGGERQRVALARALAASPQLLLMDEPLAALDQTSKREILPYLEALREELEIPMVYVSHSREEVAKIADTLVLLTEGKIEAFGPVNEMLTRLDVSLVHGSDAAVVIDATVASHDEDYHLSQLDFTGGSLLAARQNFEVGQQTRVRIAARDVSLTLQRQEQTSILNILPAIVDEISDEGDSQVTVRLRVGKVFLLSRVTKRSAADLSLAKDMKVFAQIKSVVTGDWL